MTAVGLSEGARRTRLRVATANAHRRIDGHLAQAECFADKNGYVAFLQRTLSARQPLEDLLDRSGAARLYRAWPDRRIAGALKQDLQDLGAPILTHFAADHVATLSPGGILGTLYVLEGSTLGARSIRRRVAGLKVSPDFGAHHLALQLAEPRAFATVLALLETAPLVPVEEENCVAAAVAAFAQFERSYVTI
jgi:heme oxygenase (biliverdin-IX-beta and delta-forming)